MYSICDFIENSGGKDAAINSVKYEIVEFLRQTKFVNTKHINSLVSKGFSNEYIEEKKSEMIAKSNKGYQDLVRLQSKITNA